MTCFTSIMSFVAIHGPFSSQTHCIGNTAAPRTRLNHFLALTVLDLCLTTQRSHRLNKECSTGPDHRCWRSFITIACAERPGSAPNWRPRCDFRRSLPVLVMLSAQAHGLSLQLAINQFPINSLSLANRQQISGLSLLALHLFIPRTCFSWGI